jgi:hypothetical protein
MKRLFTFTVSAAVVFNHHAWVQAEVEGPAKTAPSPADAVENGAPPPGDAPGKPGDAPGKPGDAPGKPGDAPGKPGDAPGKPGDAPGKPGDAPGNPGDAPGKPGDAPGKPGDAPGKPGDAPGKPGDAPGKPGDAPGKPGDAPGKPGDAPGKPGDAPGKPGDAPGKPGDAPGKPGDAPGKPGDAPGKPGDAPGKPAAMSKEFREIAAKAKLTDEDSRKVVVELKALATSQPFASLANEDLDSVRSLASRVGPAEKRVYGDLLMLVDLRTEASKIPMMSDAKTATDDNLAKATIVADRLQQLVLDKSWTAEAVEGVPLLVQDLLTTLNVTGPAPNPDFNFSRRSLGRQLDLVSGIAESAKTSSNPRVEATPPWSKAVLVRNIDKQHAVSLSYSGEESGQFLLAAGKMKEVPRLVDRIYYYDGHSWESAKVGKDGILDFGIVPDPVYGNAPSWQGRYRSAEGVRKAMQPGSEPKGQGQSSENPGGEKEKSNPGKASSPGKSEESQSKDEDPAKTKDPVKDKDPVIYGGPFGEKDDLVESDNLLSSELYVALRQYADDKGQPNQNDPRKTPNGFDDLLKDKMNVDGLYMNEERWRGDVKDLLPVLSDPNAERENDELLLDVRNALQLGQVSLKCALLRKSDESRGDGLTRWREFSKFMQSHQGRYMPTGPSDQNVRRITTYTREREKFQKLHDAIAESPIPKKTAPPSETETPNDVQQMVVQLGLDVEGIAGQLSNLKADVDVLQRARTQKYSAWRHSISCDYYHCTYEYVPAGKDHKMTACCLYFPDRPGHIYFFSTTDCTYWARYSTGAYDGSEWEWLRVAKRSRTWLGVRPLANFDQGGPMPQVPGSLDQAQWMLEPSLIGLPLAGESGSAVPAAFEAPAPPVAKPDPASETTPVPSEFDLPPAAPPAPVDFSAGS